MIIEHENTALVMAPEGGTVISWQHGEKHVFFPQQRVMVNDTFKTRGGMHACGPNFGLTEFAKKYNLPQHGLLRQTPMKQNGQSPARGLFRFRTAGEQPPAYPFKWEYLAAVEALSDGFMHLMRVNREVQNCALDAGVMPVCFGLHPYLSTPVGSSIKIGKDVIFTDRSFGPEVVRVPNAPVTATLWGIGTVTMRIHGYTHLVLWTDDPRYFCVEPVMGPPKHLGTPEGYSLDVGANRSFTASCEFTFEESWGA